LVLDARGGLRSSWVLQAQAGRLQKVAAMSHYIALLIPSSVGEWRVVFPDLPECEAHGYTVDDATFAATSALSRCVAESGVSLRSPRDLSEIERDEDWLSRNNIDLSQAIVTMISLAA
jgi:predicted RNase H-like HicB family nuclease